MNIIVKRFEELTSQELYEILRCRAEIFIVEQGIPYQDIDYVDQHSTHVFAVEDEKVIAYLRVIEPGVKDENVSLGRLLVMKPYREKGIAREILLKGMELALKLSPEIKIAAQPYLRDFYLSLGFVQTSDVFIYGERPHIEMHYRANTED